MSKDKRGQNPTFQQFCYKKFLEINAVEESTKVVGKRRCTRFTRNPAVAQVSWGGSMSVQEAKGTSAKLSG